MMGLQGLKDVFKNSFLFKLLEGGWNKKSGLDFYFGW